MRIHQKIVLALIFSLCTYSLVAQENIKLKNCIYVSHGVIVNNVESYSPIFDIAYQRYVWKSLKIGVAFQTYQYHHDVHYEDLSDKSCYWYIPDIISKLFLMEMGYDVKIQKKISIYPYLQVGANGCKVKYTLPQGTSDYLKQENLIPTFVSGVSAIYRLHRYFFALVYDYSMNLKTSNQIFNGPYLDWEARPNRSFDFRHSAVKLVIGLNF